MKGCFITFEGGEGAGKSSLLKLIYPKIIEQGYKVLLTREPGGSAGAEEIRNLIVQKKSYDWDSLTELLLLMSARRDHWVQTIKPALKDGAVVLCDRFVDSSFVYQGYVGGLSSELITNLYEAVVEGAFYPQRTYYVDIDPEIGLDRVHKRSMITHDKETRFEQKGLAFHQKVREGFLNHIKSDERFFLVDGLKPLDDNLSLILKDLQDVIK